MANAGELKNTKRRKEGKRKGGNIVKEVEGQEDKDGPEGEILRGGGILRGNIYKLGKEKSVSKEIRKFCFPYDRVFLKFEQTNLWKT